RVVHTDCPVGLNNPASPFADLPFQGIASQGFSSSSRPDVTPKILLPFCAFACLDSRSHPLKLVPRPRRMIIAVLVEKISSILQNAGVNLIGNRQNLAVNYIAIRNARGQGRSLTRQVGSQVDQVALQYSKPGYVGLQDIWAKATLLQEFAR